MPAYNKLCELEDFADGTLAGYMRAMYPDQVAEFPAYPIGRELRKHWEVAQAARALSDFGALGGEILGVAAGTEQTIFWATNHARRVFATDLYMDPKGWEEHAASSMLTDPSPHARGPWNQRRLVVQHMDALELHYEDDSFDGVFSSGSIEHFGDEADVRQGVAEMWRVLRPGGVATISTEYRLQGVDRFPGTLLFDVAALEEIVVRPFDWQLVEPLDTRVSERTLDGTVRFADVAGGKPMTYPHLVLEHEGTVFTSVHLALCKLD